VRLRKAGRGMLDDAAQAGAHLSHLALRRPSLITMLW